jgi:hypothetical protein
MSISCAGFEPTIQASELGYRNLLLPLPLPKTQKEYQNSNLKNSEFTDKSKIVNGDLNHIQKLLLQYLRVRKIPKALWLFSARSELENAEQKIYV